MYDFSNLSNESKAVLKKKVYKLLIPFIYSLCSVSLDTVKIWLLQLLQEDSNISCRIVLLAINSCFLFEKALHLFF